MLETMLVNENGQGELYWPERYPMYFHPNFG